MATEPRPSRDPTADDLREMRSLGERIAVAVHELGAGYVEERARRILDAWDRFDEHERARVDAAVITAAVDGTERVTHALRAMNAEDPARQRTTPLELVRTLGREATQVLADAGVAPVVRDDFEERSIPDDVYDFAPRTLGDLLHESDHVPHTAAVYDSQADLGALQLAWGLAKAKALRGDRAAE